MANKYLSLSILDDMDSETIQKLLSMPIKILCKNFDTEKQEIIALNLLNNRESNFWKNSSTKWTYYINEEDLNLYTKNEPVEKFQGFTDNYFELQSLTHDKKMTYLEGTKNKLKSLEFKRTKSDEEISEVLVEGTTDSIMLNKVIFDDLMKLTPENAKVKSMAAVKETSEIVKIASNLLTDFAGDFSIFSTMIEKSNGTTIKHMTRVFVMTLSFFKYYNLLINSGYAAKVRVNFTSKYRQKYETLLPHEKNFHLITLERVFKGGMAAIPELETNAIGVGFLLHDIGKQVDLDYFEGAEGYNKERIQAHVTNGFNELLKRTVYPPVVSAIAGFHHEYYGDSTGYGPLRDFISRKFPDGVVSDHCISYSLKDVYNGDSLCFFPAKMLEIVDVYDALTDPGRKYREPLKPDEAVEFIRDKFLTKPVKVDPILFDMFELYLLDSGELNNEYMG